MEEFKCSSRSVQITGIHNSLMLTFKPNGRDLRLKLTTKTIFKSHMNYVQCLGM